MTGIIDSSYMFIVLDVVLIFLGLDFSIGIKPVVWLLSSVIVLHSSYQQCTVLLLN